MDTSRKSDLRSLRREAGLTLDETARPLGITRAHLSKVERRLKNPSPALEARAIRFLRDAADRKRAELDTLRRERVLAELARDFAATVAAVASGGEAA